MSSATAAEQTTALVVPIDVAGLCVGTQDYQAATNEFAGATSVYEEQAPAPHAAFLGFNVARSFDQAPWDQLQVGVHLHWAMPDGLTRGGGPGAELDFPSLPSRWLVTRLAITGKDVTARSWVVQSDALSDQREKGFAVTLPVAESSAFPSSFSYLGQTHELGEEGWAEERANAFASLADGGQPLNAVANGEAAFAAYYPSCRGVFGLWDALEDVKAPAAKPARLVYAVVGWYPDPKLDPVQPGSTAAQLRTARGWTSSPGDGAPDHSLYSGTLDGISWSRDATYLHGQPVQKPIAAEAAIGNTAAEALSAHFMTRDHPEDPLFETLLDAFQAGLLESFSHPDAGDLARLETKLHGQRFAGQAAGSTFSIVPSTSGTAPARELIDLPAPLADDLNRLNLLSRQADQCAAHADWFRWQLFADWYRIFMSDPEVKNNAYSIASQRYGAWEELEARCKKTAAAAADQHDRVVAGLGPDMSLRQGPAPRFSAPTDPAVVIAGPAVDFPARYGGDGRFDAEGNLVCRTGSQLLSAVTVAGTELRAADLKLTSPAGVPDPGIVTGLLRESCLLSTQLLANLSGKSATELCTALELALEGKPQELYSFAGKPPSPVGVNRPGSEPWLPIFAIWTVEYLPLQPTRDGLTPQSYQPTVLNANFRLEQDRGGYLSYAPSGGPGSIEIDPSSAPFKQGYRGAGHLTPKPAQTLTGLLTEYLESHSDATLKEVLDELRTGGGHLIAPLSGLTEALTMRQQEVQLEVRVPPGSPYSSLTEAIAPIAGDANRLGPDFAGWFNPLRAGYMKLGLTLVDAFGQKREVEFGELACADSMRALVDSQPVPGIAYLPPRIAQPSRLAFDWLAADGSGLEETTDNPATSPVCGWLLPNHLERSLALYDQLGRPLGTLFPRQDTGGPAVGWQSAPGGAIPIDQDVGVALADQNPHLREVAEAIGGPQATAAGFAALWTLLDKMSESISGKRGAGGEGLAPLIGRPIALVEAVLRLELQGAARLDLSWARLGEDSDAGLTGVELPVVLGDLANLRDGLIGYYTEPAPGAGYDLTKLYSQGADAHVAPAIVPPDQETVTLPPSPPLDPDGAEEPPDLDPVSRRVLMLIDPDAEVHATTGVLPSASLSLPSEESQLAASTFDLFFYTAPVLRGSSQLAIPTPPQPGYAVSYFTQERDKQGHPEWVVDPEVGAPVADAVWSYTPQRLEEGWLRLNPLALEVELLGAGGKPAVQAGAPNSLTMTVTNRARRGLTFRHGKPVPEGTTGDGAILYAHFGALVAQADVPAISFAAPGWAFKCFSGSRYGSYWAASPTADVDLPAGGQISFAVTGLLPGPTGGQTQIAFDYYDVDGVDDGVFVEVISIQKPNPRRLL